MITILSLFQLIPLLIYLVDGYKEQNVKKGIMYIMMFIGLTAIVITLIKLLGFLFALTTPLWIIFILTIKPKK